jgi:hypothetical protein
MVNFERWFRFWGSAALGVVGSGFVKYAVIAT